VLDEIRTSPPPGVKKEEVSILYEHKIPATAGARWITISLNREDATSINRLTRRRRIEFDISLSQRVRDIPNDRMDEILYMESLSMVDAMEPLIARIESETFFGKFKTLLGRIPILPQNVNPPYEPDNPPLGLPPRYQLSDSFQFLTMNLDPRHLYPSDFLTRAGNDKEQLYDKVAGLQITLTFNSPEYQETYPSLQCKPPYELDT